MSHNFNNTVRFLNVIDGYGIKTDPYGAQDVLGGRAQYNIEGRAIRGGWSTGGCGGYDLGSMMGGVAERMNGSKTSSSSCAADGCPALGLFVKSHVPYASTSMGWAAAMNSNSLKQNIYPYL